MLKELFQAVVEQAHLSKQPEQPQTLDLLTSNDGRRVAFVYKGEIVERVVPPDPRNHIASSAVALVDMVNDFATSEQPTLFIGDEWVVAVLDTERRERVTLKLPCSEHVLTMRSLPKSFDQRAAIAFLRRNLHGTGFDSYSDALRNVVFERSQQSAGHLARDQESIGRAIEAKVAGTQDLPEFLRGEILVFDASVFRVVEPFTIGVDARLADQMFDFWLPPNSLTDAWRSGLSLLEKWLASELQSSTIVRGAE